MGTELGPRSTAGQAVWFGHFTLLQPNRNGAAAVWKDGKAHRKRKPDFYNPSMPAQLRELVQCSSAAPTMRWSEAVRGNRGLNHGRK